MSNIQIIKLSSGEDVISDVSEVEYNGSKLITMNKPALIMMMPKENNPDEFGIGLAPYAPFAKDKQVPVMPSHIVSVYDPEEELESEYRRIHSMPKHAGIITKEQTILKG